MAEKASRTSISREQREVLVALYKQGLSSTSSSNDEQLQEAARRTGLSIGVIKTWIGNHKRGQRPSGIKAPRKHKLLYTKGTSGYNAFVGEEISAGTSNTLSEATTKWCSLDEATQSGYRHRAAALNAAEPLQPLSAKDRLRKIKGHLKQMDIEREGLESVGMEVMMLAIDPQDPDLFVHTSLTQGGEGFLGATGISNKFAVYITGVPFSSVQASSLASSSSTSKSDLCKKVTKLFSQKYKDAGGLGLLPYKKAEGFLHVSGLPDGIALKKANHYGVEQMKKIVMAADNISFEIVNQSAEENREGLSNFEISDVESAEEPLEDTEEAPTQMDDVESAEETLQEMDALSQMNDIASAEGPEETVEDAYTQMHGPPEDLEKLSNAERLLMTIDLSAATVPSAVEGGQCSSEPETSTVAGVAAVYDPAETKKRKKKPKPASSVPTADKDPAETKKRKKKPKPASSVPTADKDPATTKKKPRLTKPKRMSKPESSVPTAVKDRVAPGEEQTADRGNVLARLKVIVQNKSKI